MEFNTVNPENLKTLSSYNYHTDSEIYEIILKAQQNFEQLKSIDETGRIKILQSIAAALQTDRSVLATLISVEMGKPIKDSLAEIDKSIFSLQYASQNFTGMMNSETPGAHYKQTVLIKQPLGVILAVMPWNYPLWQVIRVAVVSVLNGNSLIIKHSDITAGSAEKIVSILNSTVPVAENLRIPHSKIEMVVKNKTIRAVTFTGSQSGGSVIASLAGKYLKKSVLELGGNDCYVIFKDADLEKSAQICAMAKMVNNGQACISAKRFLIESSIKAEFLDLFFTELQKLKLGLAQNPSTDRGALAHQRFVVQLKKQVSEHLSTGGKLVFSEKLPPEFSETSYHPIQIVETNVDHPHFKNQEYFGPVGMVAEFTDSDQVVKAINDSEYGLGAALFAKNLNLANEIATGLQVGMVAVNAMIKSDIRVPFGGVRGSGYGKELGKPGFYEFINHQFVGFD